MVFMTLQCFVERFLTANDILIGKTVVIESITSRHRLSKTHIKVYLGPRSEFVSELSILHFTDQQAVVEMETCSGEK